METRNFSDGTLVISDGATPTANSIIVTSADGQLSFEEAVTRRQIFRRDEFVEKRDGRTELVRLSFVLQFKEFVVAAGGGDPTPYEALKGIGEAASWESTDDAGKSDARDLKFTIDDPAGGADEEITFSDFSYERISFAEGEDYDTLTVEGIANSISIAKAAGS